VSHPVLSRRRQVCVAATVLGTLCLPVSGADWNVTPRVSVSETWSDNISQNPSNAEQHEFVTQATTGVGIAGQGSRLRLNFDYQATLVRYARGTSASRLGG